MARKPEEINKLERLYKEKLSLISKAKCESVATAFETACDGSKAVFNCTTNRLNRQIGSGTDVYATYHDLEKLRISSRLEKYNWRKLRPQAEIELLETYEHLDKIHYACLSIDSRGYDAYGDCKVTLKNEMIAHRATCFDGNTALVFSKGAKEFNKRIRSEWSSRKQLCLAKFADKLNANTTNNDFGGILLGVTNDPENEEFVEVHIFGAMTAQTFERVELGNVTKPRSYLRGIMERLAQIGTTVVRTQQKNK